MIYLDAPLSRDGVPEFHSVYPVENPDWGYARTRRTVLMVPSAEWTQSVYSCQVKSRGRSFIMPNRDYPYEGMSAYHDGENWRFIDAVGLAAQRASGEPLSVVSDSSQRSVRMNPWRVTYCYLIQSSVTQTAGSSLPIEVSYYLHSHNTPQWITGCVELYFPQGRVLEGQVVVPILQPFVDVRHMFGVSNFCDYGRWKDTDTEGTTRVHLSNYNRTLTFYLPPPGELDLFGPELLQWYYKLGTGSRTEAINPYHQRQETVFVGEHKDVASLFHIQLSPCETCDLYRLFFGCGLNQEPIRHSLGDVQEAFIKSREKDAQSYRDLQALLPQPNSSPFREAILARISGLTKFKTYIRVKGTESYAPVPHAGAWWFKMPWYRDVFEGLLNNLDTLIEIPGERENVRGIILTALSWLDEETGCIPNRMPEYTHKGVLYNASDATLLCYVTANALIERTKDWELALAVMNGVEKTLRHFLRTEHNCPLICVDGAPRVDGSTGLLLCVPQHSWMDTQSQSFEHEGFRTGRLSNRASRAFIRRLYEHVEQQDRLHDLVKSPNFFLPEINAQWIVMLRSTLRTLDDLLDKDNVDAVDRNRLGGLRKSIQDVLQKAEQHFRDVFWNEKVGFLYNLVYRDRVVRDRVEGEPAIVAAALLGETILSRRDLTAMLNTCKHSLFVYRQPAMYATERGLFGILAKNEGQTVFYHDDQYHNDVLWLRSTPYLVKFLKALGQESLVRSVLVNTLDHQMTEGAIFYNHELFARPLGNNPQPEQLTCDNPVPVKNPIQFWSQWCDAFGDLIAER